MINKIGNSPRNFEQTQLDFKHVSRWPHAIWPFVFLCRVVLSFPPSLSFCASFWLIAFLPSALSEPLTVWPTSSSFCFNWIHLHRQNIKNHLSTVSFVSRLYHFVHSIYQALIIDYYLANQSVKISGHLQCKLCKRRRMIEIEWQKSIESTTLINHCTLVEEKVSYAIEDELASMKYL